MKPRALLYWPLITRRVFFKRGVGCREHRKCSLLTSYYREIKGECQVQIDGTKIIVFYERPDGLMVYEGEEVASGHFKLTCARKSGCATLH